MFNFPEVTQQVALTHPFCPAPFCPLGVTQCYWALWASLSFQLCFPVCKGVCVCAGDGLGGLLSTLPHGLLGMRVLELPKLVPPSFQYVTLKLAPPLIIKCARMASVPPESHAVVACNPGSLFPGRPHAACLSLCSLVLRGKWRSSPAGLT